MSAPKDGTEGLACEIVTGVSSAVLDTLAGTFEKFGEQFPQALFTPAEVAAIIRSAYSSAVRA